MHGVALQPWRINSSGFQCIAWSARGKRGGSAHPSEVLFSVWLEERRVLAERGKEDIFFFLFENVPCFPWKSKLQK